MPLDRTCQMCGTPFRVKPSQVTRGEGKWCGRACYAASKCKPQAPLMERVWRHVTKGDGCWEWHGSTVRGYGQINPGDGTGSKLAHRLIYEEAHGPIPVGRYVCHTCDNPGCCNPAHLWCGTPRDNSLDMVAKGRHWASKRE